MKNVKVTEEILNEVYQNAHIALQSISNLSPDVEDADVKEELLTEYESYEKLIGEVSSYMEENGFKREDINPLKKATMWGAIKMKTMMGADKNMVADMMIKGATNGMNELTAIKNGGSLEEKPLEFIDKLLKIEEDSISRWKKFL